MRKKAQEKKKKALSPSSPSYSSKSTSSSSNFTADDVSILIFKETGVQSFYDTGGDKEISISASKEKKLINQKQGENGYSMDDIWKEITTLPEVRNIIEPVLYDEQGCKFSNCPVLPSPIWDYCFSDLLWKLDDEKESKMIFPAASSVDQQFLSCYERDIALTD